MYGPVCRMLKCGTHTRVCGWLWRLIATFPNLIVSKTSLRVATAAFPHLLQYLVQEIPISYLLLSVVDMSQWFHRCHREGLKAELDCKGQFNNIHSETVCRHLKNSSSVSAQESV